jgi:hypothetical protein
MCRFTTWISNWWVNILATLSLWLRAINLKECPLDTFNPCLLLFLDKYLFSDFSVINFLLINGWSWILILLLILMLRGLGFWHLKVIRESFLFFYLLVLDWGLNQRPGQGTRLFRVVLSGWSFGLDVIFFWNKSFLGICCCFLFGAFLTKFDISAVIFITTRVMSYTTILTLFVRCNTRSLISCIWGTLGTSTLACESACVLDLGFDFFLGFYFTFLHLQSDMFVYLYEE